MLLHWNYKVKVKVHTTNWLIMLTIKVKSELDILASERKTTFTVLCLTRVLKTAARACILRGPVGPIKCEKILMVWQCLFQWMSETAYRLKTISVVNKIKHCHHLWNTLSLLKTNQAETQWYILLIGWVQRVYEQVPAFSNVCQKTSKGSYILL